MSLLDTRLRWEEVLTSRSAPALRVAILSTFTADPLLPYLGTTLHDAGLSAELRVGPFDQIAQECLSSDSTTAAFRPHVLVVWPRLEELWSSLPLPLVGESVPYVDGLVALARTAREAADRWPSTLVFVLPAIPEMRVLGVGDACNASGTVTTATAAREAVRRELAGQRGVLLFDLEDAVRAVGTCHAYDPRLEALARIPFTEALFATAGERLARVIRLSRRSGAKVVVVDADNTLWGGVVGEDGPERIDLGDNGPGVGFRAFQGFLLELRRAGVLLALCSKNEEADVWAAFARREMRLKKTDLAAWRVGWQKKSTSLRELAEELNVGVDSLVFIDDNPAELAEVQALVPGVTCIQMPADPVGWWAALQAASVLDWLPPTQDDLMRASFYDQERERKEVASRAASPEEYLAQLDVNVCIFAPTPADLPRFAQLVSKTNQFNLNGRRRSEAELSSLCADPSYTARLVSATDRFGDYGVVGAFVVDSRAAPTLDTFLLSCRAMGRGVEEAMISSIFDEITRGGELLATVEPLPRNEPARRFFAKLGCEPMSQPRPVRPIVWPSHVARRQP